MTNDFGIIITTYRGDFYFTKAVLASIKKFMPDVPICIIQDDDFSLEEVLPLYNITHVITRENATNAFVKENCFRSRCSNLSAFTESPFEKFLYLDSDLVLWGDIRKNLQLSEADFFHNEPHEPYTDKVYREQYFVADKLFKHTEAFEWKDCHFFNSGVFIARKNMFAQQEFEDLIRLWKSDRVVKGQRLIFPLDPQSLLNILVFRNKEKGNIKVGEAHMQTVVSVIPTQEMENRFVFKNGEPVIHENTIIHWAGLKPFMTNQGKVFTSAEIYFRKEHLKNAGSLWRFAPTVYFYYEEFVVVLNRYHNGSLLTYIQRKIARLFM